MSIAKKFRYESVLGHFLQDDPATDPLGFDYTHDFGLIDRATEADGCEAPSPTWKRLTRTLDELNDSAPRGTRYHLLYLGRHGQGIHNVAEAKYGTKAWDDHYSKLDSSEGMHFLDARLTETGRQQARLAHRTFAQALAADLPAPERYLVSPLDRCLETAQLTFSGLSSLPHPFQPMIHESLREVIGEHTCDKRGPKRQIQARYGDLFVFEDGFAEEDPWWRPDERETDEQTDARLRSFLDGLFASSSSSERDAMATKTKPRVWSLTVHSGVIASLLRVVGHRPFSVGTGAVIPVLLKVTEIGS